MTEIESREAFAAECRKLEPHCSDLSDETITKIYPARWGGWQAAIAFATERERGIENALRELVRLKNLDDKAWKTPAEREDYHRNKPLAWEAARAAIRAKETG